MQRRARLAGCIYCRVAKPANAFNREHVIPQTFGNRRKQAAPTPVGTTPERAWHMFAATRDFEGLAGTRLHDADARRIVCRGDLDAVLDKVHSPHPKAQEVITSQGVLSVSAVLRVAARHPDQPRDDHPLL